MKGAVEVVNRKKLETAIRSAIWEAYNNRCPYCSEPLRFCDLEIDHIIPISSTSSTIPDNKLVTEYGLSEMFRFDNYYNMIPSHHACNNFKSDRIFSKSRIMFFLEMAESKAPIIKNIVEKNRSNMQMDRTIANLTMALARGDIDESTIRKVLLTLPPKTEPLQS